MKAEGRASRLNRVTGTWYRAHLVLQLLAPRTAFIWFFAGSRHRVYLVVLVTGTALIWFEAGAE